MYLAWIPMASTFCLTRTYNICYHEKLLNGYFNRVYINIWKDNKCSLFIAVEFAVVKSNPCLDAPKLHDLERRYTSYKADTINEGYVCDVFEIPPEGKWYRTDGINMPTMAPKAPACGTLYPIWLGGECSVPLYWSININCKKNKYKNWRAQNLYLLKLTGR